MKRLSLFIVNYSLFIVLLSGCGGNVAVSGKITFSDDNTPLTIGMVFFESDTFQSRGILDSEGRYQLGSLKLTDGLPPGHYRVYINGAVADDPHRPPGGAPPLPLLETKYESGASSGLTADVDSSKRKFDFSVNRNLKTAQQLKK
ncbi:hypothetical protein FACS18942_02370 [Planctomycetales bacterium]|nr:hypothetical protein FACS18942_02370 [Planctomycetales bacterium]GHT36180.1 hypothetical protein FACS189427_07300 [Planctomycetales bacterium]